MINTNAPLKWEAVQPQLTALKNSTKPIYVPTAVEDHNLDIIVKKMGEFILSEPIQQLISEKGKLKLTFYYWHDGSRPGTKNPWIPEIKTTESHLIQPLKRKIKNSIHPKTVKFHINWRTLLSIEIHVLHCQTVLHISKYGELIYKKQADRFHIHSIPKGLVQHSLWAAEQRFLNKKANQDKIKNCVLEIFTHNHYKNLSFDLSERSPERKVRLSLHFNTSNDNGFIYQVKRADLTFRFSNFTLEEIVGVIDHIRTHEFLPMQPKCQFYKPNKIRLKKSWGGPAHEHPLALIHYILYHPNSSQKLN
jgi:hypothetical protein